VGQTNIDSVSMHRIYLSTYLHIYPSIHPSIYPSIHLSIYPSIHPSIDLSIYLYTYVYAYIYISYPIYPRQFLASAAAQLPFGTGQTPACAAGAAAAAAGRCSAKARQGAPSHPQRGENLRKFMNYGIFIGEHDGKKWI